MDQMQSTPSHELPKPESAKPRQDSGEFILTQPDVVVAAPDSERLSQAASAIAQAASEPPVVIPVQPLVSQDDVSQRTPSSQASNPAVADDNDVIEKEWVEKAKDIVAKTKDNPHEQSAELTSFKHDYMKKRYGRELKLPDEQAA